MRKTLLAAIVAASALIPAAAFAQDDRRPEDRGQWHQRGGGNEGGQQRAPRQFQPQQQAQPAQAQPQRFERPQFQPPAQSQPQAQPQGEARGRGQWNGGQRPDRGQMGGYDRFRGQQVQQPAPVPNAQPDAFRQDRRGGRPDFQNGQNRFDQQRSVDRRQQFDRGQRDRGVDQRGFDQRGYGQRGGYAQRGYGERGGNWNRDWRQDRRYDWSHYRAENRQLFRLPRYYAPGGWNYGYRRFSIGFRLAPILFEQNYWIDDPFYYQLPPAYGPYRWVRYYNDALLVDIYSGEVVDTVYDIFW